MTADVIAFHQPKLRPAVNAQPVTALKVAAQKSPPKLADIENRGDWNAALAAIWANPKNWRRSQKGRAYITINDLGICVVIVRDEGGYKWEIRWRDGRDTVVSKWIYMAEQTAINDAWDAVLVLA